VGTAPQAQGKDLSLTNDREGVREHMQYKERDTNTNIIQISHRTSGRVEANGRDEGGSVTLKVVYEKAKETTKCEAENFLSAAGGRTGGSNGSGFGLRLDCGVKKGRRRCKSTRLCYFFLVW